MNKRLILSLTFSALLLAGVLIPKGLSAQSQTGTVTGSMVDSKTGEPLISANVYIRETSGGTATDLDGKYNLQLAPGTYTLEFSYVFYQKQIVTDVVVQPGRVNQLDIAMLQTVGDLGEIMVSAERIDNNEVSLLVLQKRSLSVQDGISAQEINRVGFSNAAESMRQVTGASLEDGEGVVMRGLGDRYSISSMDGAVLPTSNPYRNSASLDLIPSNMVDNIVVKKTFSPDLPGNFTGGAVDISTKSLPDRLYFRFSTSVSYNDQTSFSNNFLTDPIDNKLGLLGYDDGSRSRESNWEGNEYLNNLNTYLINIQNNNMTQQQVEGFNSTMRSFSDRSFSVANSTPWLNHSMNITVGNRHNLGNRSLGYNLGISYGNSFTQYDERELNNYKARIPNGIEERMQAFQLNTGSESRNEVSNGLIGSLTYQMNPRNQISLMSIYNNNASESVLDMRNGIYPGALSSGTYNNRVISFVQRELLNNQVKGEHLITEGFDLNWSVNYIRSSQYEPNTRFIGSPVDASGKYFFVREVQLPFHFFRDLQDDQLNGKVDLEYIVSNNFTIKSGGLFTRKDRTFNEYRYQLENNGTNPEDPGFTSYGEASGNFDSFFSNTNTGILGTDSEGNYRLGLTYRDQTRPENSYTGTEQVSAFYVMGVYDLTDNLRTFGGARLEHTDFSVKSRATGSQNGTINKLDILPSLNLIYSLNENSNVRLSGSKTLARPNMREMATFVSFDLLGGFPIVGNPDLTRTNITNLDLRYELFPASDELFAVSAFYKNFTNPIVLELDVASDQPQYQYVNTSNGLLYGFEFELRKRLDFISQSLNNFRFSTNFTWIYSRVDLSDEELETRRRLDPSVKAYRPFPYQSSYLVNMTLHYSSETTGWEGALYANVFGPRLTANGSGAAPDTYEIYGRVDSETNRLENSVPLPDLNLRVGKSFQSGFSASLTVNNLLDYNVLQYQKADDVYYTNSSYNPGRTFQLSFTYAIN